MFLTGHTGFKGGWLALWLHRLGAKVFGYALDPDTEPCFFASARVGEVLEADVRGDVRDLDALRRAMEEARPDVVIHMAAQPLVRRSYRQPVETYATNVMGTVHVLEAARALPSVQQILVVTSDKCYENRERARGYREDEPLGGLDPYSSSKACAELVTAAYRRSFFANGSRIALASARAGNVIGGGDWAEDRLIPDMVRAWMRGEPVRIRHPEAVRPWQHVLEALHGYLVLMAHMARDPARYSTAWNFGPDEADARSVAWMVARFAEAWGAGKWVPDRGEHPPEAGLLRLDCAKAKRALGWRPRLDADTRVRWTAEWYRAFQKGMDMHAFSLEQIQAFEARAQG